MKINEVTGERRSLTAKEMTLIMSYDPVYSESLRLLHNLRRLRDIGYISVEAATYLADQCREVISNIDNLPRLTTPFPRHIRSGLVAAYGNLLMTNANPE